MTGRPDVIIVGAGIIGTATALALRQAGASVTIVERYRPAAMASGWTLAGVRQSGRHPAELPLARRAVALWRQLDEHLDGETGYRQSGNLRLARSTGEAETIRALVSDQSARGLDVSLVEGEHLRALAPDLSQAIELASWCPGDGHADPHASVEAYRAAAERAGVRFRVGTAARSIKLAGERFEALVTEGGELAAGAALLATGVQTNDLLAGLGRALPIAVRAVTVVRSEPVAPRLRPVIGVANADLAVRQENDGRLRMTSGAEAQDWRLRETDGMPAVAPSLRSVAGTIARVSDVLPFVADIPISRIWAGLLDMTPDALPVLDRVDGIEGLFVAAGFSGHGFGIGPVVGELLADRVLGRAPALDLEAFRFDRFGAAAQAPCSPLELHG